MCLPDFIKFEQIEQDNAITGYRTWRSKLESNVLEGQHQNYEWPIKITSHKVEVKNSGIYSYNNYEYYNYNYKYKYYNYKYNNNYKYYNYNNNYKYYNYNYKYSICGIIKQYGRVAIHEIGYRSQYAEIDTLFSIRKLDAEGCIEFLNWIDIFNKQIENIAIKYNVLNVISWQDFSEQK